MAGRLDRRALAALLAALAVTLGAVASGPGEPASGQGGLKLKRIGGFDSPVYVEDAPGARGLLFVVEQPGTVRVVRDGRPLARPFLNIRDQVRYGGEQGLLSIAFDPAYARNRRFYVYYVTNSGDIRVDGMRRMRRTATRAEPSSRRKVIEVKHPRFSNHNGGQLQFGPDGSLFVGTGDGGSAGDPNENAQNRNSLLGKLLRIDPRKRGGYSTPSSNPFDGGEGQDEVYSLGLRNPYRFSFDRKTNDLLIGDVGQDEWEEIDHVGFDAARGANFGWDLFEGTHAFEGGGNPPPNYKPPIHEYPLSGGKCAVTGGYVVRDPGLPSLAGRYLYADFCGGEIRSLDPYATNPSATDAATGLRLNSPSSFGEGAGWKIYVTSLAGGVFRISR